MTPLTDQQQQIANMQTNASPAMTEALWTWCPTCYNHQDHERDGGGWKCQRCGQVNNAIRERIWHERDA